MKLKISTNLHKYITVAIFVGLIFGPGIVWFIFGEMINENTISSSENRVLAAEPAFDIRYIEDYPKQFEKYYDDNVPFRKLITEIWANLNYRIFKDSSSDSVVVGKTDSTPQEAWLFYSSDGDGNPVKEVQGLTTISENDWVEINYASINNKKTWDKLGVKYYAVVTPDKENIYREYLSNNIEIYNDYSRVDKLMARIAESGINNVIYLKPALLESKAKNEGQIYYKHDTHWNKLGAFYGYQRIMKEIEPNFNTANYKVIHNMPIINRNDLPNMLGIKKYFVDYEEEVNFLDNSEYTDITEKYQDADLQILKNKNAPIKKRLFIVGDSYREALIPYFAKTYSEVFAIHVKDFDKKVYQSLNPDVVLLVSVERYATGALKLKF